MLARLRRSRTSFQCLSAVTKPVSSSYLAASRLRIPVPSSSYRAPPICFQSTAAFVRQAHTATAHSQEEDQTEHATASKNETGKFADLAKDGKVDPVLVSTIVNRMGLNTMTPVQALTIDKALQGVDVLAQAKTGTGKTLAFLLPLLQRILGEDPTLVGAQRRARYGDRASDIRAIVISPTRELAEQIAVEARRIVEQTGIVVQTAVGGTQKRFHLQQMHEKGCHVLVATPGRLKDILQDPTARVSAPNLDAFVLDEADRLMDQGFWPEIQEISELLPPVKQKDRQTLMFSATIPKEVAHLARMVMKPSLHYVRTTSENETPTVDRVTQKLVTVPGIENILPAVLEICNNEIQACKADRNRQPFKAIVYFPATVETGFAADTFSEIARYNRFGESALLSDDVKILQIHSRLSQQQRTRAADTFRTSKSAILMSSDVTSRGMDFPNVTHVIQAGLCNDRNTYIHRIGRTARAGQEGEGWMVLAAPSMHEARMRLGNLPLQKTELKTSQAKLFDGMGNAIPDLSAVPADARLYFDAIQKACKHADPGDLSSLYMANLGTWGWFKQKEVLVQHLNRMSMLLWGLSSPPPVSRALASKMGLMGIDGLNIGSPQRREYESMDRGDNPFGDTSPWSSNGRGQSGRSGFGRRDSGRGDFGRRDSGRGNFGGRDFDRGGMGRGGRPDFGRGGGARGVGRSQQPSYANSSRMEAGW